MDALLAHDTQQRDQALWVHGTVAGTRDAAAAAASGADATRLAAARAVLAYAGSCPPCCAASANAFVQREVEEYVALRKQSVAAGGAGAGRKRPWAAREEAAAATSCMTEDEILGAAMPSLFPEQAAAAAAAAKAAKLRRTTVQPQGPLARRAPGFGGGGGLAPQPQPQPQPPPPTPPPSYGGFGAPAPSSGSLLPQPSPQAPAGHNQHPLAAKPPGAVQPGRTAASGLFASAGGAGAGGMYDNSAGPSRATMNDLPGAGAGSPRNGGPVGIAGVRRGGIGGYGGGLSNDFDAPSSSSSNSAPAAGLSSNRRFANPRAAAAAAAAQGAPAYGDDRNAASSPPPSRYAPRYGANGGPGGPGSYANSDRHGDRNERAGGQLGFVSAAQQLEVDEAKKGNRVGAGGGGGGGGGGSTGGSGPGSGGPRKTLGVKRFVPPFKRSEPEGGAGGGGGGGAASASKPKDDAEAKKAKEEKELAEKIPADLLNPDGTIPDRLKNVDPELLVTISNEILENSYVAWDDIAGLEHAKSAVYEAIIWPLQRPDLFEGIRGPTKGLLLFGPPGTGKTMIGKAIASESDSTFFNISASTLMSKWVGEGEKMVRALFAVASCKQPAVVFIDEIDSLLTQRSDGEQDHTRRLKTEFLVQLDGAGTSADDRILIVGATNRPQELDEAARRRMEKRLYIPLPDASARGVLITRLLKDVPHAVAPNEVELIVKKSVGYSGADMKILCREAALNPLRELGQSLQTHDKNQVRPVVLKDFAVAFQCVKPTVSDKDIAEHVKFNDVYGSFSAKQTAALSKDALDNFFDDV